jgi:hypothetical protein
MGFNKKIVGKSVIEQITMHPAIIELYLRADSLTFEDDEVQTEFEKLKDEFLKTNPNL